MNFFVQLLKMKHCKLKILKNIGKFGDTVWVFFEIDLKWSSKMVKKLLRGVYLR